MIKRFSVFLLIAFFIAVGLKAQIPAPPTLGPGEVWTNLWSVSYDYQTNGSVRYLVQDPSNAQQWCAILMSQQDSNSAVGVQRYIYYSYSIDNGVTWTPSVLDASVAFGFPCITLRPGATPVPVIACHQSSSAGSRVWKDLSFGAFGFEELTGVPIPTATPPIWPHITASTNGNLIMVAAPNPGFVGAATTYTSSWGTYLDVPMISGPSGNFDAASGPGGKVALIGTNYNGSNELNWYRSADNGVTWDAGAQILPYVIDGGDTLFTNIAGGFQAVYDDAGNAHIVFAAYNISAATFFNANTIAYVKPTIFHWSSATSTLSKVAHKGNIPTLTDTITTALIEPLCMPTITKTSTGKLVCAYTTYLRGNTQIVDNLDTLNCGEIFASASADNGATWGTPINQTSTPFIEEKHPSFAPETGADVLRLYYLRDLKAGGWVNVAAWGKAAVYGIYKSGPLPPTGIRENVSQAKTYELFQNYPNPFNPSTTISYYIQKTGFVSLKIYDAMGREVANLVNGVQAQGPKEITFSGSNLASGIYYYSITAGDFKDTKKMMLIK